MTLRSTQPPPEPQKPILCETIGCFQNIWPQMRFVDDAFPEQYRKYCHRCAFWTEILDQMDDRDHLKTHLFLKEEDGVRGYTIGTPPIDWSNKPSSLGFGGHWWYLDFTDKYGNDQVKLTNNLWARGTVPEELRDTFINKVNVREKRSATSEEIRALREDHHR